MMLSLRSSGFAIGFGQAIGVFRRSVGVFRSVQGVSLAGVSALTGHPSHMLGLLAIISFIDLHMNMNDDRRMARAATCCSTHRAGRSRRSPQGVGKAQGPAFRRSMLPGRWCAFEGYERFSASWNPGPVLRGMERHSVLW